MVKKEKQKIVNDSIKINDNFLTIEYFNYIQQEIFNNNFPWYCDTVLEPPLQLCEDKDNTFFCHLLYINRRSKSNYFHVFEQLFDILDIKSLIRAKLNLYPRTNSIVEHGYHQDNDFCGAKSAILYLNSSNGYTKFRDSKQIIESKENRIITFDSELWHTSSTCTDNSTRVNLNINYF